MQALKLTEKPVVNLVVLRPWPIRSGLQVCHMFGGFGNGFVASGMAACRRSSVDGRAQGRARLRVSCHPDFAPHHVGEDLHQKLVFCRQSSAGDDIFGMQALGLEGCDDLARADG